MPTPSYTTGPIPTPDLENWNTDRTVDPIVMVRGMMVKTSAGWGYWDGTTSVSGLSTSGLALQSTLNTFVSDYFFQQSTTPNNAATGSARATQISMSDGSNAVVPLVTAAGQQEVASIGGNRLAEQTDIQTLTTTVVLPKYANTAVLTNVTSSATAVTLKSANGSRLGLTVVNDSTKILYIKYGSAASATDYTFKIFPQGTFIMDSIIHTGIITGIWASANGFARVTELSA